MTTHEGCDASGALSSKATSLAALVAAAGLLGCDGSGVAAPDADPDAVQRGARLLAQYHCGSCHTIPGVASARGRVAVTLASFGRRSYIAGHIPNSPDALVRWIVDPASVVPLTTMPSMGASAADARDMAAYLGSLR